MSTPPWREQPGDQHTSLVAIGVKITYRRVGVRVLSSVRFPPLPLVWVSAKAGAAPLIGFLQGEVNTSINIAQLGAPPLRWTVLPSVRRWGAGSQQCVPHPLRFGPASIKLNTLDSSPGRDQSGCAAYLRLFVPMRVKGVRSAPATTLPTTPRGFAMLAVSATRKASNNTAAAESAAR